jgi:hypothetical protein
MARLNEILVGRFNRTYQKLFGIKGPPPVATLAPEVMPTHEIFRGVEDRYSEAWNRFGAVIDVSASVGNSSSALLRNPAGTNIVGVIEKLFLWSLTSQGMDISYALEGANLGTGFTVNRLDTRMNVQSAVCTATGDNSASVVAAAIMRLNTINGTMYDIITMRDQEIPLPPGAGLRVVTGSTNVRLVVVLWWRERFLEEGERI